MSLSKLALLYQLKEPGVISEPAEFLFIANDIPVFPAVFYGLFQIVQGLIN